MSTPRLFANVGRRAVASLAIAGSVAIAIPSVAGAVTTQPDIRTTVSSLKASAAADTAASLAAVQQRCGSGITNRQTQIDQLNNRMAVAKWLTSTHHSTLSGDLSTGASGLTALNGQIAASTTLKQVAPLCKDIVYNFRIYVLRTPQVHLTIGGDAETAVVTKLQGVAPKLDAAIKAAQAKGQDVGQAPSLYADFTAKLADAAAKSNGASDTVIALTVDQYNAGTARPVLQTTYQNLVLGHGDLIAARNDATQIVQILKSLG